MASARISLEKQPEKYQEQLSQFEAQSFERLCVQYPVLLNPRSILTSTALLTRDDCFPVERKLLAEVFHAPSMLLPADLTQAAIDTNIPHDA